MAADGSIVIQADLDDKKAQAELNRLVKKINDLNAKIKQAQDARLPLLEQAEALGVQLDAAKAKLAEMQAAAAGTYSKEQIAEQKETVKSLQAQWDAVQKKVERYDRVIDKSTAELETAENRAGELAEQLANAGDAGQEAGNKTASAIGKLEKRLVGLARRVFIFSVITSALRGMRSWLSKAVKSNDEAASAIARLKGALLTLAQPILQVVIPAFTAFVNVLTKVIAAIASIVSSLFGTTAQKSAEAAKNLYDEQNAIKGVGGAAKKASKQLAAFDEINKLSGEDAGGGGSGGAAEGIAPDFSGITDEITPRLKEILDYVLLIGAGLALLKIAGNLPGVLGEIGTKIGGIAIAVGGLLLLWDGLQDAWNNGVGWGNLIEMVGGLAAAMGGLYIAFGPVAAGIAGIVGGLALLVTGFRDAMNSGWSLQNTLLVIAGILATGIGIALLTSSLIPALIAAIAALLLAFTVATGHGEELLNGIRTMLEGFKEFFTGVFTGDIEKAIGGIEKIFDGLKTAVFAVFDGLRDTILGFLDWLDEKTGGKLSGIIQFVKNLVIVTFDSIKTTIDGVIDALKQIFTGLTQFISGVFTGDWERAWEGIKDIFKGIFNGIVSILEGAVNLIVKGINWIISKANTLSVDIPDIFGGGKIGINIPTIPEWKIPRLAQGAVIPPNREFMAVLGDQRSGNNIEAPEELIRKIVREEAGSNYGEILRQILRAIQDGKVLAVDGLTFGRLVHQYGRAESARVGASLVNGGNV